MEIRFKTHPRALPLMNGIENLKGKRGTVIGSERTDGSFAISGPKGIYISTVYSDEFELYKEDDE